MKHYGDITKINGATVKPVDAIIGGSPCQDLSVAGNRAGLAGARSGLFMEQIRIIKEMRSKTNGKYPRFMVWENVPGAFSSNKSEDFRIVIEETARIADENAVIPRPPKDKWQTSGCIMGDGWSIAWRVLDAQFWGVPQRRRRIALVADFGGQSASEILFERNSLSGDSAESGTQGKRVAGDIEGGVREASKSYCIQGNCIDRADTAGCNGKGWTEDVSYTLNTIDRPAVLGFTNRGQQCGEAVETLRAESHGAIPMVYAIGNGQVDQTGLHDKVGTLNCMHDQQAAVHSIETFHCDNFAETASTLKARDWKDPQCVATTLVRRLTPLEYERLQGFPDGWTDIGDWYDSKGKLHKTTDSNRYKALGNSIALPPWTWILRRLSQRFTYAPTMASLFDGIGGFPLIWEWINGRGPCLWASEIEEYPIAVTKLRFPGVTP